MKIRTLIGLSGATAASLVGMAGLVASPAGAGGNGAVNMPASQLTSYLASTYHYPFPGVVIFTPLFDPSALPPGVLPPNFKVSGDCETVAPWLFTEDPQSPPYLFLNFTSGNAVAYRGSANAGFPTLPGGLNAEGTAELLFVDPASGAVTDTGYGGPAHVWLGQNGNANGQSVGAETVSFSGANGSSMISITVNPGGTTSAGQPPNKPAPSNGWAQQNVSCS